MSGIEKIYKDALRRHVESRVDRITDPGNFTLGFMTYEQAEERLSELLMIAQSFCMYEQEDRIKSARKPIRRKIDEKYVRQGGRAIYGEED